MAKTMIAAVAVVAPLPKLLDYRVPEQYSARPLIGVRFRVPLGRRSAVGFVMTQREGSAEGLKELIEPLDEQPLFPPIMGAFLLRAADYYRHPPGEVLHTALPVGLGGRGKTVAPVTEKSYHFVAGKTLPGGEKQRAILEFIRQHDQPTPLTLLREHFGAPHATLQRLTERGLLRVSVTERNRDPFTGHPPPADRPVTLNNDQCTAIGRIEAGLKTDTFTPLLLHGVTGSGKTEVYLNAVLTTLQRKKSALILVPEIGLTPQLVDRFRARLHGLDVKLAVLHSGLGDGERFDAWRAIARGDVAVVIGARSAVFAPLVNPGIIIVDEEHESSYKQSDGFRYHARDLALLRGQMQQCVVVLGSATPSSTSYQRATAGPVELLELPTRIAERPLPQVELIDLTVHRPEHSLSEPLVTALEETLARREQALLLLNRRGFAPYLLCTDCGRTWRCPNCAITLTYHRQARQLRCHYCDYHQPPIDICPDCQGTELIPDSAGTERLAEELQERFPAARIARMDRDTTTRKGAQAAIVRAMEQGDIDVLIGTQMIAKGLDFPAVTLVGILGSDATLNLPDFRAAERAFALFTQAAGRAGRGGTPGRVYIQSYATEHYALTCSAGHDYRSFFALESAGREELGYPPFGHLINLVLSSPDVKRVETAATLLAQRLLAAAEAVDVLGPAPCPLGRLRGRWRYQILLKSASRPRLRQLLDRCEPLGRALPSGVRLAVDVDPIDML
ncbi:MAG: primosomal protein N' [Desulfuromonadales bacterium]|nr:primosomal protein N' [Desulfuromonadales bacterium]MDT8422245.1 primosomal protein N' [Desulfuromonadales bacterium]